MSLDNLSNNDWQSFTYSALILIMLLTGLFSRKEISASKILKYLSAWLVLVLLVIIAYSYRFDLKDLYKRFSSEINPANAKIDNGQIIIRAAEDGHFYINTRVNNAEIRFMIDTGASSISLNLEDARKAGIKLEQLTFNQVYQTANGKALGASISLDTLEINGLTFHDLKASVNQSNMGVSLLGISFLKRMKKYEFYQDQLTLTPDL